MIYSKGSKNSVICVQASAEKKSSCAFSLAISFDQWSAHDGLHEHVGLAAQRRTSASHCPDLASKAFPDLVEDDRIVKGVSVGSFFFCRLQLGIDATIDQALLQSSLTLKFGLSSLNDSIVQPRDRHKYSRFDNRAIVLQFQQISACHSAYHIPYTKVAPS